MSDIRPRRSVLYMPGSNARALEKARTIAADALILDLEDAVAPDAKDIARQQVCDAVDGARLRQARDHHPHQRAVDAMGRGGSGGRGAGPSPTPILVPKISDAADLHAIEERLLRLHADPVIALWAMVETPLAILNIAALAGAGGRLACFVMGTNDLIKELRGTHTPDRANLSAALGLSVAAARANGLAVIDGVFNDIQDTDGFARHCHQAKSFGFDGKTLIHPSQVEPCNAIFAPSPEEVIAARQLIAAFELPENRGKGAIKLDGRMVELLHAEIARRTVALADAIAALETRMSTKTITGNFFEDFHLGQRFVHATPRTLTHRRCRALQGDLWRAVRAAIVRTVRARARLQDDAVRRPAGLPHGVRQDACRDISLNAVANLGYAQVRFGKRALSRRDADGASPK